MSGSCCAGESDTKQRRGGGRSDCVTLPILKERRFSRRFAEQFGTYQKRVPIGFPCTERECRLPSLMTYEKRPLHLREVG